MKKAEILRSDWIQDSGEVKYHGWPTILRCSDGKLLAAASGERIAHVCPRGRVVIYESCDNGLTWSERNIISEGPLDDRDAGLLQTPAGTILTNWFTSLAFVDCGPMGRPAEDKNHPDASAWSDAEASVTIADIRRNHAFYMKRSTDGGKSWSEKYRVPINNVHGPCVLNDGSLLWAGRESVKDSILVASPFGPRCIACRSTDDGLTWQEIGEIKPANGHVAEKYHELHQVQAADGTIICHIRNQNFQGDYYMPTTWQCCSTDGGKTWSEPEYIFEGFPSFLNRLRDGRLMVSYADRRQPYSILARFSEDNGRSWGEPILISDDLLHNDMGYTSSAELEDGTFITLWYARRPQDDGIALLRYAVWKV